MSRIKRVEGALPRIDIIATGERINRLRTARGMSVKDIQRACGFTTPNAIYKWIRGENLPTIDNFIILADLFGTTIDDIVIVSIEKQFWEEVG